MEFQFTETPKPHFFYEQDGEVLAKITYDVVDNDVFAVDHTFVSEKLRGQGVAKQLLEAVVEKAQKEGKKIKPICSYVVTAFKRNPEYQKLEAK